MKLFYVCILVSLPLLSYTHPVDPEDNSSSSKSIVVEDSDHAESESSQIAKRSGGYGSGGFDIFQNIKTSVLSGVGRASASFASASSGGSGGYKSSGGEHANSVSFDPISLKKSILGTIFQAVKAITGGVTAIKGQLLKGSGYALAAGGKLVAVSGDKVTDVGKAIVHSAQLGPPTGGAHPFIGKFSGLSSGLSSGSAGVSSGHPASGPAGHSGETITSYEIPSGHGSYGPPSKAPSSYGSTQYLPAGGFGGGGAHFTGSAAFEGWPSKYGIPLEGPTGYYGELDPRDAHSASQALKEIEHLIPLANSKRLIKAKPPPPPSGVKSPPVKSNNIKPVVEQYPIPDDPQPSHHIFSSYNSPSSQLHHPSPFKLETVSETKTITTAHGAPIILSNDPVGNNANDNIISYESYFSNPIISQTINSSPWDVYHSMSHKNAEINKNIQKPSNYYTSSSSSSLKSSSLGLSPIITAALATVPQKAINNNYGPTKITLQTSASQNIPSYLPPPLQLGSQLGSQSLKSQPYSHTSSSSLHSRPLNPSLYPSQNHYYNRKSNKTNSLQSKRDYPYKQFRKQHLNTGRPPYDIIKSKGFHIRNPAQFNRQLLY